MNAFRTEVQGLRAKARERKVKERVDQRIERLYYKHCSGIQINIMDMGRVFEAGHAAIAADHAINDEVLGEIILDFVQTIRRNVKLNSTAVVEGDIFHRTLVIEENARFDGMSRRQENMTDASSRVPLPQAVPIDEKRKGNGASDSLNT
jgi:hypothetical protein